MLVFLHNRSLSELNRKLDDNYKQDVDEIFKRLSAKNQEKLADLLANQEEEEEEYQERTKDLPPKVKIPCLSTHASSWTCQLEDKTEAHISGE